MAPRAIQLSDAELAFQQDRSNWAYGPTFDLRFFCAADLPFQRFADAIRDDELCLVDVRIDAPTRVLLRHPDWTRCVGCYFYDFDRDGRREPSLIIYPGQWEAIAGEHFDYPVDLEAEVLAVRFLIPMIGFAERVKRRCDAEKVLLFTEDRYPTEDESTRVFPSGYVGDQFAKILNGRSLEH